MGLLYRLLSFFKATPTPERLVRRANVEMGKENYMAAATSFTRALELEPLYIAAYDGLGKAFFRLGYREEAEREFAIADGLERLKEDRSDFRAAMKVGVAMTKKSMYKEAISFIEPVLQKTPHLAEAVKMLGISYMGVGNDKKARDMFRKALELSPRDSDIYMHLGSLETKTGNKQVGERLLNIARLMAQIDADPNDLESRIQMAKLFMANKKYKDAAEYLRQTLLIEKNNAENWLLLGQCYIKGNAMPAAIDALKNAAKLAPSDPKPMNLLAQVYKFTGRFDESRAARQVARVLEGGMDESKTPQQAAKYVKYLLAIAKKNEAKQKLNDFLAKWPEDIDLKMIHGSLLVKDDMHTEALNVLKSVVLIKDDWAEPHIWMAMAYQKLGDNMSALAEGQLATRLAPRSPAIYKMYGDILREQKKFSMAENAYETAENLKQIQRKPAASE